MQIATPRVQGEFIHILPFPVPNVDRSRPHQPLLVLSATVTWKLQTLRLQTFLSARHIPALHPHAPGPVRRSGTQRLQHRALQFRRGDRLAQTQFQLGQAPCRSGDVTRSRQMITKNFYKWHGTQQGLEAGDGLYQELALHCVRLAHCRAGNCSRKVCKLDVRPRNLQLEYMPLSSAGRVNACWPCCRAN